MVKGVIFDMDGTMFDTECLSTKGWIYAGKKLGVDIPIALTDSFRGRNPQSIRKKFAEYFGDRLDYDEARAMKHEYFDEVTKDSVPHKEGLRDLLEYLDAHKIPAVIATSTEKKRASRLIHVSGVEHLYCKCDIRRYGRTWKARAGYFSEGGRVDWTESGRMSGS